MHDSFASGGNQGQQGPGYGELGWNDPAGDQSQEWRQEDEGYILSYLKATNNDNLVEIKLVTPDCEEGDVLDSERALIADFSVKFGSRWTCRLGGNTDLPDSFTCNNGYYAETYNENEKRPAHKRELVGLYETIVQELTEDIDKIDEGFIEAVSDPLGYENAEALGGMISQQLADSYSYAVDRLPKFWSDHLREE